MKDKNKAYYWLWVPMGQRWLLMDMKTPKMIKHITDQVHRFLPISKAPITAPTQEEMELHNV